MAASPIAIDGPAPAAGMGRPRADRGAAPVPERRRRSGLLFSAALLALLAIGVAYLMNPRTLPIRLVRVNGEFAHLSPAALQARAEDVVRGGFFDVNVDAIRAALLREPWVRDVTVRRVWPDELNLLVQEQTPAARWGDDALLNDSGRVFRPGPDTLPEGLPALRGPDGSEAEVLARFRDLQRALEPRQMRAAGLTLSERRSWSFRLVDGPTVNLGRSDFAARLARFVSFVPVFLSGELGSIEVIDMRYTNGFAVRRRGAPDDGANAGRDNHGQTQS